MNKRGGFTLIELLAVIVILAIIAVIAVPIVLNIIDETKNNATLRSAEMYVKSAELSIAQSTLKDKNITDGEYNIKDGDICLNADCTDKLDVEVNGETPTSGKIAITNGNISSIELNYKDGKTIVKNSDGDLVYFEKGKLSSICKPVKEQEQLYSSEPKTAGYKYECKVDPNKDVYAFYVLNSTSTEVNLIMAQNINSDGTPVTNAIDNNGGIYNLVAWNSSGSNTGGPVDAMQFLYNATKDWTNIDPITYEYKDKDYQGATDKGYTSFVADNGALTITSLSGTAITIGSEAKPLRARMPIYSAVWKDAWTEKTTEKGEVADKTDSNSYLYDNLDEGDEPCGYWTLSSDTVNSFSAWRVNYVGRVSSNDTDSSGYAGVRPVINLKI